MHLPRAAALNVGAFAERKPTHPEKSSLNSPSQRWPMKRASGARSHWVHLSVGSKWTIQLVISRGPYNDSQAAARALATEEPPDGVPEAHGVAPGLSCLHPY